MKLYKLTLCALLAAAAISCTKEITPVEQAVNGEGITEISAYNADSDPFSNDGSKTVLASDGSSILWSPGDEVNVFYGASGVKFTSLNTQPSASAIFGSDRSFMFFGSEGADDYLWAVYPYSATNSFSENKICLTVPSIQNATAASFARGAFPSIGRSHTTSMGFFNVCGGLCFKVSNTGVYRVVLKSNGGESLAGKVKVGFDGDGRPAISEVVSGVDSVILSSSKPFSTDSLYYISVLPTVLSSGFTISFRTADSRAVKSTTKSNEIKRNVFGNLGIADSGLIYQKIKSELTDLSKAGTANCYIVSKSGDYKFNATVKGSSSESVGTPASAEVLWESFGTDQTPSVGDIVKNVSLDAGYVKFSTPSTLNNGNAVIAVKDASSNILWSWHIWVCKDFDAAASAQVYNNSAGTMMDRNLGATSATPGDVHALGLLYQWGRKDPFLSGNSISSSTVASSTLSWPSAVSSDASNGTIAYAVKHPTTFIGYNSNNYDWYYTGSSSTDTTRWQPTDTTKGVYDPCPAGWRVPDGGSSGIWSTAFGSSSSISNGPWDDTNKGMDFGSGNGKSSSMQLGTSSAIWYPAAGYRNYSDGSLYYVGTSGSCWSCTPNNYSGYALGFSGSSSVYPSINSYRANGQSVRCIKDETFIPQPEYVDLGLSVKWATCNIGATKPEESGKYFAWGDVTGQTWNGSSWSGGGFSSDPICEVDSNNNLKPAYDAAHSFFGGNWRMPTKSECQELIDNCTCTWTDNYNSTGVAGQIFTSNKTGYTDKSIFLPAAGYGRSSRQYNAGFDGRYWSSTFTRDDYAWRLHLHSSGVYTGNLSRRSYGFSVRPVTE